MAAIAATAWRRGRGGGEVTSKGILDESRKSGEDIPYLKHQDKLRAKSLQPSPSVVQLPPPASILSACLGRRGPGVSCNHISAFCSAKPEQTGTRSLHHVSIRANESG